MDYFLEDMDAELDYQEIEDLFDEEDFEDDLETPSDNYGFWS